jgi:hypothetical protein
VAVADIRPPTKEAPGDDALNQPDNPYRFISAFASCDLLRCLADKDLSGAAQVNPCTAK